MLGATAACDAVALLQYLFRGGRFHALLPEDGGWTEIPGCF